MYKPVAKALGQEAEQYNHLFVWWRPRRRRKRLQRWGNFQQPRSSTVMKAMQKYEIEACARHAHEGHRTYRELMGDYSHASWEETPESRKFTVRNAVIGIVEQDDDAKKSHDRWMASLVAAGWKHGNDEPDYELKTHPCLVPWEDLSDEIQELNKMFVRSVKSMITALWHLPS